MFGNQSYNNINLKNLNKYLCKTEAEFLKRLYFWSSHKKNYGTEKNDKIWIYNTLDQWAEQLDVSKSSVRRAIESLKNKEIIDSDYLAPNKRNRTLSYSINYEKLSEYLSSLKTASKASTCVQKNTTNEQMVEHMNIYNKQNINKSYKSINDSEKLKEKNSEPKPTIVQDMIKIWNDEFPGSKINLTKQLARFLVAAFKSKFDSSLKNWRRYLKTIKTSVYLMSEKFKLSIWWVIKFFTIDRIRAGELGVNEAKVEPEKEDLEEKKNRHFETLDETEFCRKLRYRIIEKLSLPTYLSWFTHATFFEIEGKITMKATSQFIEDWIRNNFADQFGFCVE
ncbi:MAG: hypothetical protein FWC41_06055 [Firmicutes bacterium]|nr:hypothetical protein [Bacillota bacterium]